MNRALIVTVFLFVAACGGGATAPSAPSTASIAGTWSGTVTSNIEAGAFPTRVTLAQTGSNLSGTWSSGANSGSLTGALNGSGVSMTMEPSDPRTCPFRMTATVAGSRMTGTYAAFNCTVAASGGITMTRQ